MNELDEWYEEMMKKALTDTEKNRIQKEYDKRKEKGKGKPFFWFPSGEESNAIMMKENPQYAKDMTNKINQSLIGGRSIAKTAEGFANTGMVISALNGDKETAKELAKTSKGIRKGEKEMKKLGKGNKSESPKEKSESPKEKSESKPINYTNLNESFNNPNSTFEGLKKYYQGEKGMSDDEFAKLIKGSDWSKGKKAEEWLNNYDVNNGNIGTVSYSGSDNKKEEKTTLKDLEKSSNDEQDKEAYSDAQVFENVTDTLKKDKNDYDEMNKITDKLYEKSSNVDDYYKENLPKSIWNMYKNGEFDGTTGDKKKDKKIGKERLGYLIMNHLGNGIINASLIARGSSPTQVSDLQKIRNAKLEGALERYNKKRDETMSKTLEQLGLNTEMLNKFNLDLDTLKNNKIFEEVSKSRDRKNFERTIRAYAVAGKYLGGLTDKQKKDIGLAIMALNSKDSKDVAISTIAMTIGDRGLNAILDAIGLDE